MAKPPAKTMAEQNKAFADRLKAEDDKRKKGTGDKEKGKDDAEKAIIEAKMAGALDIGDEAGKPKAGGPGVGIPGASGVPGEKGTGTTGTRTGTESVFMEHKPLVPASAESDEEGGEDVVEELREEGEHLY